MQQSRRVITRIKGGLGNQLFCYSAGRRLALVNHAELILDTVTGFARDFKYRRRNALENFAISARRATWHERLEPFGRYRRALARAIGRHRPFDCRYYIQQEGLEFDPRLLSLKVRGTVYVDGYWQSEGYFKDIEKTIRQDLRIIPPTNELNQHMAKRIASCNAVALHVRWFHNPQSKDATHNVGLDYYANAIGIIRERIAQPHFFLFSDQPEAAKDALQLPGSEATCVSHNKGDENAYADLWLMSQCKHFIIANSTFSWWGAWLSRHEEKVVIAPGMVQSGISSWGFQGLLPEEWIRI